MGAMPEAYKEINFQELFILKQKFPKIYEKVEERLETGWDATIDLIEKGIKEGTIRPVNTQIVKITFESTLEKFFQKDVLVKNNMTYQEGLEQVVNLIVDGLKI